MDVCNLKYRRHHGLKEGLHSPAALSGLRQGTALLAPGVQTEHTRYCAQALGEEPQQPAMCGCVGPCYGALAGFCSYHSVLSMMLDELE